MDEKLITKIAGFARAYAFPVALIVALIEVESSGDTFSMRFEPHKYEQFLNTGASGPVTAATERVALATSWGLMQVMGYRAREHGYRGKYLSELCNPDVGLKYGLIHLSRWQHEFSKKFGMSGVIAAYNAGAPVIVGTNSTGEAVYKNQRYVDKVNKAWGDWRGKTI